MELETVARELAKLAIHQDAGGTVETDHMVDILKRLFPQHPRDRIAALVNETLRREGAIAQTGARMTKASRAVSHRL